MSPDIIGCLVVVGFSITWFLVVMIGAYISLNGFHPIGDMRFYFHWFCKASNDVRPPYKHINSVYRNK